MSYFKAALTSSFSHIHPMYCLLASFQSLYINNKISHCVKFVWILGTLETMSGQTEKAAWWFLWNAKSITWVLSCNNVVTSNFLFCCWLRITHFLVIDQLVGFFDHLCFHSFFPYINGILLLICNQEMLCFQGQVFERKRDYMLVLLSDQYGWQGLQWLAWMY